MARNAALIKTLRLSMTGISYNELRAEAEDASWQPNLKARMLSFEGTKAYGDSFSKLTTVVHECHHHHHMVIEDEGSDFYMPRTLNSSVTSKQTLGIVGTYMFGSCWYRMVIGLGGIRLCFAHFGISLGWTCLQMLHTCTVFTHVHRIRDSARTMHPKEV